MLLEISNSERQYLTEVIEAASRSIIHEIDHTDSREYRKRLQERLKILEDLVVKIKEPAQTTR
jgi:hypothetical protein